MGTSTETQLLINVPRAIIQSFTSILSHNFHLSHQIDEPTLLITRYEYANLYHTTTDWYNVYQTLHTFALPVRDTLLVFVDGHSEGAMDPVWPRLFGKRIRYFKHLLRTPERPQPPQRPSASSASAMSPAAYEALRVAYVAADAHWQRLQSHRRLCFARAYTVAAGYRSSLSVGFMGTETSQMCRESPLVRDFTRHVLDAYALPARVPVPFREARLRLLFILRHDYKVRK